MDASTEAALALQGARGAYAILLGSGVSRAAGIMTGWEVTLNLVMHLAVAEDGQPPDDSAAWYRDRYGSEPDSSVVLEKLAPTPAERRERLHAYFEPYGRRTG